MVVHAVEVPQLVSPEPCELRRVQHPRRYEQRGLRLTEVRPPRVVVRVSRLVGQGVSYSDYQLVPLVELAPGALRFPLVYCPQ